MSRLAPYLLRRGDSYAFRIAVPADLQSIIGSREIVRTLGSGSNLASIPFALEYAARAKRIFSGIRAIMEQQRLNDNGKLGGSFRPSYSLSFDLNELGLLKGFQVQAESEASDAVDSAIRTILQNAPNLPSRAMFPEMAQIRITPPVTPAAPVAVPVPVVAHTPTPPPPRPPAAPVAAPVPVLAPGSPLPMLSTVIDDYTRDYPAIPMLAKHKTNLPVFLKIIGNKPVSQIRQADIKSFFTLLCKLPPYFENECEKQGMSYRQLAEQKHVSTIGESTFKGYRASVGLFLKDAADTFGDQGFPQGLSVDGYKYTGNGKKRQNAQRAFSHNELKRLYEGDEYRSYAANPEKACHYWLPLVGLYTGARVNEVCQLNPQSDIRQDEDGIWYFVITEDEVDGKGHADVDKSVKMETTRQVPIHHKLLELGFIDYFNRVKATGERMLFPEWSPLRGRAAGMAERWFRDFLKVVNLHGAMNKKGRALRGYHAFRHTLLSYGRNTKPEGVNLFCITGHKTKADGDAESSEAGEGYIDEDIVGEAFPLLEKRDRLDKLDYGLNIPRPVLPAI